MLEFTNRRFPLGERLLLVGKENFQKHIDNRLFIVYNIDNRQCEVLWNE